MKKEARSWMKELGPIKGSPMIVLDIIVGLVRSDGYCDPSKKYLSTRTGFSINTVTDCLRYLEACGYIKIGDDHRPNGSRKSNQIQVMVGAPRYGYTYRQWRAENRPNSRQLGGAPSPTADPPPTQLPGGQKNDSECKERAASTTRAQEIKGSSSSSSSSSSDHVEVTLTPTQRLTYTHSLERAREMCAQLDDEELWKAYVAVHGSSWGGSDDPLAASNLAAADAITQEISKRFLKGGGE